MNPDSLPPSAIDNRPSANPSPPSSSPLPLASPTPNRSLRLVLWLAGIALLVVASWWSLHFPFDPERLYRAVPADSSVVTEHQALGARWPDLARNPLVLAAVGATNATDVSGPGGILDRQTCAIIGMLAERRTLVAYAPAMGIAGEPAWIIATYAGSKAQLLRWALGFGLARGMDAVRTDGMVTWIQEDPSRDAGRYLSIGISDGILVACLSNVREAAFVVLRRMETRAPLADVLQQRMDRPDDGVPDRLWLRWYDGKGAKTVQRSAEIRIEAFTETNLRGSLRSSLQDGVIRDVAPGSVRPWDFARRFIPDPAIAVALLEPAGPRPFTAICSDAPLSIRIVASALDRMSAPEPAAFAAIFHGELSGRLFGLKVPAIVLGVRARPGVDANGEIRRVLDSLNAANRWGLLHREVTLQSGRPITIVDSSKQDMIASLAERERPAVVVHDGWVLLSSCAATLDELIAGKDPPGFQRDSRWARSVDPAAPAAFWLDAAAVEPAMRHALAVYEISLMLGDPRKVKEARDQLDPVRRWSAAAAELQTVRLTLSREGNTLTGRFAAGPEQAQVK